MNTVKYNISDLLKKDNSSKLSSDWNDALGLLFKFNTLSKDSIVSGHSLTCKIPDAMAMATMYSNSTTTISPATAGGSKAIAIGSSDNDVKDGIMDNISPGYIWDKFGNSTGMTNDDINLTGGFTIDVTPQSDSSQGITTNTPAEIKSATISSMKFNADQYLAFKDGDIGTDGTIYNTYGDSIGKMRNPKTLFYLDIMKYLIGHDPKYSTMYNQAPLIPIEISLTMDGISGIFPGNCFQNDYMPKHYNEISVFQVFTSTQELDSSG